MPKKSKKRILTEAHRAFAPGLSRYAHLKIQDSNRGDDLVQVTFLKTWQYLQKNGKIDLMRAFLYHVLNRLIIDEYRKPKVLSLDLLAEKGLELEEPRVQDLFNIIDGKSVAALIKNLPEKYRSVLTMRYVDEMSIEEISASTHQLKNTVSTQLHRGLIKLKLLATL